MNGRMQRISTFDRAPELEQEIIILRGAVTADGGADDGSVIEGA